MKNIDIIPCVVVTSLETDAFRAIVAYVEKLMVRATSSRGRDEDTPGSVAILNEKKKVQGCVSLDSDPMNSVQRKAEELGLNASTGHTWNSQDAPGAKLISGTKKGIWRHYSKRWTSWAKSLRAQFGGTTTWGNLTTSRLYQQSSVDFVEETRKLKPNIKLLVILLWRRQRQKIVCLKCIRELQCSMLSKENWAQIQWILWKRSKNAICDSPRPGRVQINE